MENSGVLLAPNVVGGREERATVSQCQLHLTVGRRNGK